MLSSLPTSGLPCLCLSKIVSVREFPELCCTRAKKKLTSAEFAGPIKGEHSSSFSLATGKPTKSNVLSSASNAMPLNLGDTFPNFSADSTSGEIKFHDAVGDGWAILFSHPADFTPVCTTELGRVALLKDEFTKRDCKLYALSCDSVESHKGWSGDVMAYAKTKSKGLPEGEPLPFPIIADPKRELAVSLGMVDPDEKDSAGLPLTCRAVFIVGPDKKLKLSILYPATTGRNFDEILRALDSLQLTAHKKVATPENWKQGEKCMVLPTISADDAKKMFPDMEVQDLPSKKAYLRYTPQPK